MQIWHFCRSPVDPNSELGGVSNVVAQLAHESAELHITTHVVCSNIDLGRAVTETGGIYRKNSLYIHRIKQHRNLLTGPFHHLKLIIDNVPQGSIAHVHGCFSAFAEFTMHQLEKRDIPYIFSLSWKAKPRYDRHARPQ